MVLSRELIQMSGFRSRPSCIAGISETKDLADGLLLPVDPSSVGASLAIGAAEVSELAPTSILPQG